MYNLTDRVKMMVQLGLVNDVYGYLKPVDGVGLFVGFNTYKLSIGTKIEHLVKMNGGYFFMVGENLYKLRSHNFMVKHDDDIVNLDLELFKKSKICSV